MSQCRTFKYGLRRTFATVAANSGKPINIISLALGHADLKTRQSYLMTTQDEVVNEDDDKDDDDRD